MVKNFSKIGQTDLEISCLFNFQDGRRPPSWIFENWIFWTEFRIRRANMLTVLVLILTMLH